MRPGPGAPRPVERCSRHAAVAQVLESHFLHLHHAARPDTCSKRRRAGGMPRVFVVREGGIFGDVPASPASSATA